MSVSVTSREEFERTVSVVADPVRRYLARRVDPATADDVLSETLAVLWRRRGAVPDTDLVPWAIGIARLQLSNALRAMRREERLVAKIITVDPPRESVDEAERDPAVDLVHPALAALRPADAELLRLWAWEELTIPQIASVLDISANAVSIRLHRAKKKLGERLRKMQEQIGHADVTEGRRS